MVGKGVNVGKWWAHLAKRTGNDTRLWRRIRSLGKVSLAIERKPTRYEQLVVKEKVQRLKAVS